MGLILTAPGEVTRVLPRLWLSTIWNAKQLLSNNPGVGLVLNGTDEVLPRISGLLALQLGPLDREVIPPARVDYALPVLQQHMRQIGNRAVLVCCHASMSRSPAIVLAYFLGCGFTIGGSAACLAQPPRVLRQPFPAPRRAILPPPPEQRRALPSQGHQVVEAAPPVGVSVGEMCRLRWPQGSPQSPPAYPAPRASSGGGAVHVEDNEPSETGFVEQISPARGHFLSSAAKHLVEPVPCEFLWKTTRLIGCEFSTPRE